MFYAVAAAGLRPAGQHSNWPTPEHGGRENHDRCSAHVIAPRAWPRRDHVLSRPGERDRAFLIAAAVQRSLTSSAPADSSTSLMRSLVSNGLWAGVKV